MLLAAVVTLLARFACASSDYYHHIIFDNSLTADTYFCSTAQAS